MVSAQDTPNIEITASAQAHFHKLLQSEATGTTHIRLFVAAAFSPKAEVGITFCPEGEEELSDVSLSYPAFKVFVDRDAIHPLQEAKIDFQADKLGGQLAITAPYLKGRPLGASADMEAQLEYVIQHEINPGLASHGGYVSLVSFDAGVVVLRFAGGCQGCGMVGMTLKSGIEKTLKEKFPEVRAVRDVTDHSQGENPYY